MKVPLFNVIANRVLLLLIGLLFSGALQGQEITKKAIKNFEKKVVPFIKGDSLRYGRIRNFSQEDLLLLYKNYPHLSNIQLYRLDSKIDWTTLSKFTNLEKIILGGPGSMQSAHLQLGTLEHLEELTVVGDIHVNLNAPKLKRFSAAIFQKPLSLEFLAYSPNIEELDIRVKKLVEVSSRDALEAISKVKRLNTLSEVSLKSILPSNNFVFPHLQYLSFSDYQATDKEFPNEMFGRIDSLVFTWGFRDSVSFPSFKDVNLGYLELKPLWPNSGYSTRFAIPKSLETLVFNYSQFEPNIHIVKIVSLLSGFALGNIEDSEGYKIKQVEARIQELPDLGILTTLSSVNLESLWDKPKEDPKWEHVQFIITKIKNQN